MTEIGQGVDFSPLKLPDYVGDYRNAFQVGRELAARQIRGNAFAPLTASKASTPLGAADRADILANLAIGLKGRAYAERSALLAHLTPVLATQGFSPDMVRAFDPSDENLDAFAGSARALGEQLAHPA